MIQDIDEKVLLAINGLHSPFMDQVMLFFSNTVVWFPLYLLLAVLLFFPDFYGLKSPALRSEKKRWVIGIYGVIALILCVLLCDQIAHSLKLLIERPRPGYNEHLANLLNLPDGKGGRYGFPSNHATNTFCFALLTASIFRKRWFSVTIILWSLIICYSRMYLGRHYPLDILAGIILGTFLYIIIYYTWKYAMLYRRKK